MATNSTPADAVGAGLALVSATTGLGSPVEPVVDGLRPDPAALASVHVAPPQTLRSTAPLMLGALRVSSVRTADATARGDFIGSADRGGEAGEPRASLVLTLQVAGSSVLEQDGRRAVLRPGDLAVHEPGRPHTLSHAPGVQQHLFWVPMAVLALPPALVVQITGTRLASPSSLTGLAADYFSALASPATPFHPREADALGRPSVELIRALVLAQGTGVVTTPSSKDRAGQQTQVLKYVRAHLREPDLTPVRIARDNHMSLRQLYKVMSRSGISLNGWIRTERLEACRTELLDADLQHLTVAAVARHWGFSDPTSFGRAFKAVYGLTPRQWRGAHHPTMHP